jgi:hypothetical protein
MRRVESTDNTVVVNRNMTIIFKFFSPENENN